MDRYFDLRYFDVWIKDLSGMWWSYLLIGLLLIAWGIAIVMWPQLLVAFVAALFIMAGVSMLGVAWRARQIRRRYQQFKRELIGI